LLKHYAVAAQYFQTFLTLQSDCVVKNLEVNRQHVQLPKVASSERQTWGDYITNVIDYDYLPPARLRLRVNKTTL